MMTEEISATDAVWGGWYGRLSFVLAIVLALPLWVVTLPPLVDYPNHLARGYILYHHDDVPSFAEHFDTAYRSTPSLAMDLFMVALQPICDVRLAGRLFLTLTVWLWLSGWHVLGWAIHGRPTWLALGGALVAYHSMFLYGFTNFSFGLGLYLWATAAWITWSRGWSWLRLLGMTMFTLACYGSHVAAYLLLTGTALAVTAWDAWQLRTITRAALAGLLPVVVPGLLLFRGGGTGGGAIVWNTLQGKLVGALCLVRGYDRRVDLVFIVALAIFLVLLLVWSRHLRARGGILFAGLGCVAMFVIGPVEIFGGAPADARFLPPASALVVLSLDAAWPRRRALVLLVIFLSLVLFRYAMITAYWRNYDKALGEQVALFEQFDRGARVYPLVRAAEGADEQKLGLLMFHALNYAVLERQVYVPHLLAFAGQQPLHYKTPPLTFHARAERYPEMTEAQWRQVLAHYDYFWCYRVPERDMEFLRHYTIAVASRGQGAILQVLRTAP